MGILSGMAGATIFGSGRNPEPGSFKCVELQKIIYKNTSNPKKAGAAFLIGEHTVLEFTGTTYTNVKGEKIDTTGIFKTGDSVSRVIKISDPMYGKANTKEYMAAVWQAYSGQRLDKPMSIEEAINYMSTPEGEAEAETFLAGGSREKEVKGLLLRCEAWWTTKNDGAEDFTAQKWTAHDDDSGDDA